MALDLTALIKRMVNQILECSTPEVRARLTGAPAQRGMTSFWNPATIGTSEVTGAGWAALDQEAE